MKKRKNQFIVSMICLSMVFGFFGNISIQAKKSNFKKPVLNKKVLNLYKGQKSKLSVKNAKGRKITYKSSKSKIVSINKNGRVYAKKTGTAKIYVKIKGGKKLTCRVKVGEYMKSMTLLSAGSVVMKAGASSQIRMRILPAKALYKQCTYKTSNKSVVTVSSNGKMSAVGSGLAKVTMTSKAVTKKKKMIRKTILVFVEEKTVLATPAPTPHVPDAGSTDVIIVGSPTPTVTPNPTSGPTSEPTQTPTLTPTPAQTPQTLQDMIHAIPTPANNQLLAAQYVVADSVSTSTLYLINRNYTGSLNISLNGKAFRSGDTVVNALNSLVTKQITSYNSAHTIMVDSFNHPGYWLVYDLTTNPQSSYSFNVYEVDPFYGSPYGLIIANGDTSKNIVIN